MGEEREDARERKNMMRKNVFWLKLWENRNLINQQWCYEAQGSWAGWWRGIEVLNNLFLSSELIKSFPAWCFVSKQWHTTGVHIYPAPVPLPPQHPLITGLWKQKIESSQKVLSFSVFLKYTAWGLLWLIRDLISSESPPHHLPQTHCSPWHSLKNSHAATSGPLSVLRRLFAWTLRAARANSGNTYDYT